MTYIVVSDLHGNDIQIAKLMSLLDSRGWNFQWVEKDGVEHPVLTHDNEMLIVAGDSNDRGPWSVPISYLMASSWVHAEALERPYSVLPLLGNHDLRIRKWAQGEKTNNKYGFGHTRNQLESGRYKHAAKVLAEAVPKYPLWYIGDNFIAVHAYWQDPMPNEQLALYGPTEKSDDPNLSEGLKIRIPWWETADFDKAIVFGHYHARMDMIYPEKNLYCIDNHDIGVFSYVVAQDSHVSFNIWKDDTHNLLMEEFKKLIKD